MAPDVVAFGPGRVNLIGDHTDYNGGLALPMAIDLGVTVTFRPSPGDVLDVRSDGYGFGRARLAFGGRPDDPSSAPVPSATSDHRWLRLVAAVADLARPETGGEVEVTTTLPDGVGLSSSAALSVALAQALGVDGEPLALARLCREAEHRIGAPVGLMDPWVCAGGRRGHALLLDFAAETAEPVPVPDGAEIVVVDSGVRRAVASSAYVERVAECQAAAAVVGPLGSATPADLVGLRDPTLRRRARHVVTECARVRLMAEALATDDLPDAGRAMGESHRSLAVDFEVSTPELDGLVADLTARPGVLGARLTGAGFGGCVVVLARPGSLDPADLPRPAWTVRASDGASRATVRPVE
jgi:galactokinase